MPNDISAMEIEIDRENSGRVSTVETFCANAGKPSSHVDVRVVGAGTPSGDFIDSEMVDAGEITGVGATCREKFDLTSADAEFLSIGADKSS